MTALLHFEFGFSLKDFFKRGSSGRSSSFFLLLFLRVGQKSGHDAEKWQIGAGIENEPDACLVSEPSEEYRYSLSIVLT